MSLQPSSDGASSAHRDALTSVVLLWLVQLLSTSWLAGSDHSGAEGPDC